MYTITVTVDDLVQEGVELLHDKFLQDFAEMNHTGFTIEISEQSVEEAMEEAEQLSEIGMSAESAEDTVQRMLDEQADRINGEDFSIFGIEEELRNIGEEL